MLTDKIIKLANNTQNYGLKNNFTHKVSVKNKKCGDKIIVELVLTKGKINSMRYITESCVYCQASASLFSNKIEKLDKNNLLKLDTLLKKSFKEKVSFAKKYSFLNFDDCPNTWLTCSSGNLSSIAFCTSSG